jgi:multidrug efflux pump subunit AcrA (membrane-fusion protein)
MSANQRRAGLASLIVMAALLSSCGSKPGNPQATPATVTGVTVETVHLQDLPEEYHAVGTVRSATSSVLGSQISGTVLEIRVKPGDRVQRGEILAVLDDRSPRAQLASADAGVEASKAGLAEVENALQAAIAQRKLAEVTYHRYQELLGKDSVTRQEFDSSEAAYKSAVANEAAVAARKQQMEARALEAQSQRESVQTTLSYSRIVSPIDGLVTAKSVDAGTLVMPGTPLLTVEDAAHYRLEASVPEDLLPRIHSGEQAQVTTEHGQFSGGVVEVVPAADAGSRTFVVKVALPEACGCRSGEYGTAAFATGELKALAVPRSAVVERGELEGVYVVDQKGVAGYRLVRAGKILGDRVEILSGLSDGEQVATSQLDRLSDGVRVEAQ